jgi:hypothetical protein
MNEVVVLKDFPPKESIVKIVPMRCQGDKVRYYYIHYIDSSSHECVKGIMYV